MLFLTLSIRGFGGVPKRTAFRRLVDVINPNVIFLQETMVSSLQACDMFLKMFPSWHCCGSDALGISGGLLSTWNPLKAHFSSFKVEAGILLEGRLLDLDRSVRLLNVYSPYSKKIYFWDRILCSGLLNDLSLILAGDFFFSRVVKPALRQGLGVTAPATRP